MSYLIVHRESTLGQCDPGILPALGGGCVLCVWVGVRVGVSVNVGVWGDLLFTDCSQGWHTEITQGGPGVDNNDHRLMVSTIR